MSIEIIAVGNEVLSGMIVNTNAAFISAELAKAGWYVTRHTVLPDDPQVLENGLREALARSILVITTGGLGPTCDDLTRTIAAKIFNSPLQRDEALVEELQQRFGKTLASLEHQGLVPIKAKRLPNHMGTASGFFFSEGGHSLALLPGPPREMSPMLTEVLLPKLPEFLGVQPHAVFAQTVHLCCLREEDVDPLLRRLADEYPGVGAGIYPGYGSVTVRFFGADERCVRRCVEAVERDFGTYLFEAAQGKIEEAIHEWFKIQGKTLAFAESCTGGKMATLITALPGASEFFLGSIVAYSNRLKKDLLGVSPATLQNIGAVSEETVKEMLAGLFRTTRADYAIAVSGIAGPTGGTPEKPVGTVWAAIGERNQPCDVAHMYLPLHRETLIAVTANRLLGALWRKARFGIPFRSFEK
jgi:nicotinamide-nucleotide amidase